MHDETPGGQAVKDRALAFWTDPNNFSKPRPPLTVDRVKLFAAGWFIGSGFFS